MLDLGGLGASVELKRLNDALKLVGKMLLILWTSEGEYEKSPPSGRQILKDGSGAQETVSPYSIFVLAVRICSSPILSEVALHTRESTRLNETCLSVQS